MNTKVLIVPYFGKFNNYFQLFLNSCACNKDFDWLFFTDDKTNYNYSTNCKVIYCLFDDIKKIIKEKFKGSSVQIEKPFKLCDYRPMYGYIFEDYISNYEIWGHCDTDLIFGKISDFIDFNAYGEYDKFGVNGHLTLYRNKPNINKIFMSDERYKKVISTNDNMKFDEEFGKDFGDSINNIFENNNKKIKTIEGIADIYVKSSDFQITRYDINKKEYITEKKQKAFFVWDAGKLYRYYTNSKKKEEYLYIHLQKRKMQLKNTNNNLYKIIPNSFEDIEEDLFLKKDYEKIKIKNFNLHYFKIRTKNLKIKLENKIKGS